MHLRAGLMGSLLIAVVATGVLAESPETGAEPPSAASAIHWQTDTIDLRADDVTLRLGDETFSAKDADVTVIEDLDTKGRWNVYASWEEAEYDNTIRMRFRSDGTDWYVEVISWWVTGITLPDGDEAWGDVGMGATNATRTPVGQTLSGDLVPRARGYHVPCETDRYGTHHAQNVDASVSFENLNLTVQPRERSFPDKALRFLGLDGLLDPPRSILIPQMEACDGRQGAISGSVPLGG